MIRTYYKMWFDDTLEDRWYLGSFTDGAGIELDGREFRYGRPIDVGPPMKMKVWRAYSVIATQPPLRLSLDREYTRGGPLDLTFTSENVPVANARVAAILGSIAGADIQRIPVVVEEQEERYEVINVISRFSCVDRQHSTGLRWWTEADGRPDKIGHLVEFHTLIIDAAKAGEHHIFRPWEYGVIIVVSDVVKGALEEAKVSGLKFKCLSL
jgi:hypothetical protein